MAEPIAFRFDFASPYSYLASERIDALAERFGREVVWKPVLLGAIFKHYGTVQLTRQPGMHDYALRDFARSASFHGISFRMPLRFPVATQAPARAYYWLLDQDEALAKRFAHAVFRTYFGDGRDVSEPATILNVAAKLDVDPVSLSSAMEDPAVKERLREETDAAIALGMFGAPWITVDGEHFWGNDRLSQVEYWLENGGF
ncbi:MAG: 2-hydroxychromene-2-carboxylate isomerase [Gammaproteobacteria bacterium]|nr:2-hydroxychromene-2-carboxylate isomerase [Gammaproteobacteria bacterium]MBU1416223.1 2-hydroxychromene-2-carboxylate isomerase [Gammaproteobacteria bacterium]